MKLLGLPSYPPIHYPHPPIPNTWNVPPPRQTYSYQALEHNHLVRAQQHYLRNNNHTKINSEEFDEPQSAPVTAARNERKDVFPKLSNYPSSSDQEESGSGRSESNRNIETSNRAEKLFQRRNMARAKRRIERMGLNFEDFRNKGLDFHSLAICARKYPNQEEFLQRYQSYRYWEHNDDKVKSYRSKSDRQK